MQAPRLAISIGLALAIGAPALGQQRVNPVTINPGGGAPTIPAINISPTTYVYGTPYGYGYHGYGYGAYGRSGFIGAPIVVSSGGGYGPGYGGYGGYGFGPGSVGDFDPIAQQQQAALAASRYEMQNAQATESYARANLLQQQAIAAAIQNRQAAPPAIRERFNARTTRPRGTAHAAKAEPALPLDKLMTPDSKVLWPAEAPQDGTRDEFDAAMTKLAKDFRDEGQADVKDVNAARDALQAYGVPALAKIRKIHPTQAPALKTFLNSLDATLVGWAK